jgi:hypothetical protein
MLPWLYGHRLRIAAFTIAVTLLVGCGFDAIFQFPGPGDVHFVFGDTVLTRGTTVPFVVTVIAGGTALARPHVTAFTYNAAVFTLTTGGDSLVALRNGQDSINIRFLSSLLTGVAADTVIHVRVKP